MIYDFSYTVASAEHVNKDRPGFAFKHSAQKAGFRREHGETMAWKERQEERTLRDLSCR